MSVSFYCGGGGFGVSGCNGGQGMTQPDAPGVRAWLLGLLLSVARDGSSHGGDGPSSAGGMAKPSGARREEQ